MVSCDENLPLDFASLSTLNHILRRHAWQECEVPCIYLSKSLSPGTRKICVNDPTVITHIAGVWQVIVRLSLSLKA